MRSIRDAIMSRRAKADADEAVRLVRQYAEDMAHNREVDAHAYDRAVDLGGEDTLHHIAHLSHREAGLVASASPRQIRNLMSGQAGAIEGVRSYKECLQDARDAAESRARRDADIEEVPAGPGMRM